MTGKALTVEQVARILPALHRCPHHPETIVLPWYSFRCCCLYAALQAIRDTDGDARALAAAALIPNDARILVPPNLLR